MNQACPPRRDEFEAPDGTTPLDYQGDPDDTFDGGDSECDTPDLG